MGKNNFGTTLLVGIAAAATALLFAPKSGKDLRNELKEQGLQYKDMAKDKADNLANEFKRTYHEVEEEMNYANPDPELTEIIEDIETDLYHPNQEKAEILHPEPVDIVSDPAGITISQEPAGTIDTSETPSEPDVLPTADNPVTENQDINHPDKSY